MSIATTRLHLLGEIAVDAYQNDESVWPWDVVVDDILAALGVLTANEVRDLIRTAGKRRGDTTRQDGKQAWTDFHRSVT